MRLYLLVLLSLFSIELAFASSIDSSCRKVILELPKGGNRIVFVKDKDGNVFGRVVEVENNEVTVELGNKKLQVFTEKDIKDVEVFEKVDFEKEIEQKEIEQAMIAKSNSQKEVEFWFLWISSVSFVSILSALAFFSL